MDNKEKAKDLLNKINKEANRVMEVPRNEWNKY